MSYSSTKYSIMAPDSHKVIPVLGSSMAGTLRQGFSMSFRTVIHHGGKEIIPAVRIDADVRLRLDICALDEF